MEKGKDYRQMLFAWSEGGYGRLLEPLCNFEV